MTDQEPFYTSQSNDPMLPGERADWVRHEAKKANDQGATWSRATAHPKDENIILYEAWKERPKDEGNPRFHLSKR